MLLVLARYWWIFLLKGLFAIALGILAFVTPIKTLFAVLLVWGVFAVVEGVASIVQGIVGRRQHQALWPMVIVGLLGVAAGIIAWAWPGLTAFVLLAFIAFWSIFRGIFEIVAAIRIRKEIEGEWLLILAGLLSVVFGLVLLIRPGVGLLTLMFILGVYALLVGVATVFLALRLRKLKTVLEPGGTPATV
jgi:uncharacterized membrane protein HdeD (DUF308 family)